MRTIHEKYFDWLYKQLFTVRDLFSDDSFMIVCDIMWQLPFRVIVPMDDNRAADGMELRNEFVLEYGLDRITSEDLVHLMPNEASVLEVLLALARRADFLIEKTVSGWFIQFIGNLKLTKYTDRKIQPVDHWTVDRILRKFNDRKYTARGLGGIFPLKHPDQDQREVELWYQMAAYMTENHMY